MNDIYYRYSNNYRSPFKSPLMRRSFNIFLLLPLLVFTTGSVMAQSADKQINNKTNTSAAVNGDTKSVINNDTQPVIANVDVYPNPTKGMLTIKTECVGKVSFYSLKGKEKGSCMVNEGTNIIYLETVLNPGTYICKFEGVNGSTGEVRVVYQL